MLRVAANSLDTASGITPTAAMGPGQTPWLADSRRPKRRGKTNLGSRPAPSYSKGRYTPEIAV